MNIAAAVNVKQRLLPNVNALHDAIAVKVKEWDDVIKNRAHPHARCDASHARPRVVGYEGMLADDPIGSKMH